MTEQLTPKQEKRLLKWAKNSVPNHKQYTVDEIVKIQELRTKKFDAVYKDVELLGAKNSAEFRATLNILDDTESLKSFEKKIDRIKLDLNAQKKFEEEKTKSIVDKVRKNLESI